VAADGAREEGTAVGAVAGSLLGGSIGHSTASCAESAGYYQTGGAPYYGGPLGSAPPAYPAPSYPSSPDYGAEPSYRYEDELYGGPELKGGSGPAAEECQRVMRVTELPDGREIHEPITVCREAHYGEWNVQ
jgi:hypothetical protein